ncbi:MAG: YbaB/EbfC family nucleoid-associated protein [Peptococcaceae bacterium]|nr:YbaB/EbfC family nucleoid-associated protein [Peptococcaceae bacterium]
MNMGNMSKMMKQVQKMQADMAKLEEELATRTVEATAGGGLVRAVANGRQEIMALEIKPEAVDPEDVETLNDLVLAAVNSALSEARKMASGEMSRLTGGMNIPGLF